MGQPAGALATHALQPNGSLQICPLDSTAINTVALGGRSNHGIGTDAFPGETRLSQRPPGTEGSTLPRRIGRTRCSSRRSWKTLTGMRRRVAEVVIDIAAHMPLDAGE
jgi:hypothetical protein